MKYLVNIESLDYARQRELEREYKTVIITNDETELGEFWLVVDDEKTAEQMEKTIENFNKFFKIS